MIKHSDINDIRALISARKSQCYFESEIVAWVFVWYPEGDNIGHVSMVIGDLNRNSSYVSWWPIKKVSGARDFFSKGLSKRSTEFDRETNSMKYKTCGYTDDFLSEGNCPHVIYGLRTVNARDMENEWRQIVSKQNSSFIGINKNCASIVSRVLKAGLRNSLLKNRVFGVFGGDQYIWTPKRIAVVCNQLRDNNVAWKIEMPGRSSEKTFFKTIARLR